ncbi:dihydropteroate synthase [Cerasicoccus maritimus]|uniref:dihydropteroate synthase n=1 Tax=Cerasicoccus maritimus TaxID=490089 RepID=UPI002852C253|nr:dihydropteroate synthase [Cerasicoccus maritimus]
MDTLKQRWTPPLWGQRTYLMGILNVTPDSFSDGGQFATPLNALGQAQAMVREGADLIDVGAESTRPGAETISAEEEIDRLLPVLEALEEVLETPISVDTYKASVARKALEAGAHIINDIWGFQHDPDMAATVAEFGAGAVLMHNGRGAEYTGDIVDEVKRFLEHSINLALHAGVDKSRIVLDPGIGFGKSVEQNLTLMRRLGELRSLGFPILLGASRKSVIGKTLDLDVDQRLEGTLATSVVGVQQGADIIRVHDLQANQRAIRMADAIYRHG